MSSTNLHWIFYVGAAIAFIASGIGGYMVLSSDRTTSLAFWLLILSLALGTFTFFPIRR